MNSFTNKPGAVATFASRNARCEAKMNSFIRTPRFLLLPCVAGEGDHEVVEGAFPAAGSPLRRDKLATSPASLRSQGRRCAAHAC